MISRIGVQPVVSSVGSGASRQTYRVGDMVDGEEQMSNEVSCTNDLSVDGNVNLVHWHGEGALFRVYRSNGSGFEMLTETSESQFIDSGDA